MKIQNIFIGVYLLGVFFGLVNNSTAQTIKMNKVENKSRAEIITMALNLIDWDDNKHPPFDHDLTRILANKNDLYVSFHTSDIIYVPQKSVVNSGTSVNLISGIINNSATSSFPPIKAGEKKIKHKITLEINTEDKNAAIKAVAKSRKQTVEELKNHVKSLFPSISLTIVDYGGYYSVSEYMEDSYEWSYSLNKNTGEVSDEFSASIEPMPTMEEGGPSDDYIYKEIKPLATKSKKAVPQGIGCKKR